MGYYLSCSDILDWHECSKHAKKLGGLSHPPYVHESRSTTVSIINHLTSRDPSFESIRRRQDTGRWYL